MFFSTMTIPAYMPRALSEDVNQPELRDWRCFEMNSDSRPQTEGSSTLCKGPACACR